MKLEYETVRVEDHGEGLLLVTLSRPEVANAMNTQMGRDLLAFFEEVNAAPANQRWCHGAPIGGPIRWNPVRRREYL